MGRFMYRKHQWTECQQPQFSAYLASGGEVMAPVVGAQWSHRSPMVFGGQMHCPVLVSQLFPT
ncbi:hypothetical protein F7725_019807 [Dissostichus mawsoni]|uniref:Uncharacterized protein n=1 Tax=Dissostichus mawsoni TaxID=36200 RepID=A0A7J5YP86_DISMA|nr:hypothetical protein F7725_019807 [Dissostichus mawsoni]